MELTRRKPIILLIEDTIDHQVLLKHALERMEKEYTLHIANSGEQALDYLFHNKEYSDPVRFPLPDLIFLDLGLPFISGMEVLKTIKGHERLKIIPVILLTAMQNNENIEEAYAAGANAYIPKPIEKEELVKILYEINQHWFEIVSLPQPENIR